MKQKICSRCHCTKPIDEFNRNKATCDGCRTYMAQPEQRARQHTYGCELNRWCKAMVKTILSPKDATWLQIAEFQLHHKLGGGQQHRKYYDNGGRGAHVSYWYSILNSACNPRWYAVLTPKEHAIADAELKLKMLKSPTFAKFIKTERMRCRASWIRRSMSSIERIKRHQCDKLKRGLND